MAEFQLQMKEHDPVHSAGLFIMTALFPIWGLFLPATLLLFIVLLLRLPASVSLEYALAFIAGLALISISSALLTVFLEDSEIKASKAGLSFPLKYFAALRGKLDLTWEELADLKLDWKREADLADSDRITLVFKNGGIVRLKANSFYPEDLEQFLIAFETCQSGCNRDAELDDFEYALQSRENSGQASYTQIWEKSLSNRFSSATFIPLEPGTKVQNGRYHILRQLGFGGFAAVYLARSREGDNHVLKESVFPQEDGIQSKAEELFKKEAAILSKLQHQQIAAVFDYFIENGRHYLSMEYMEGKDLASIVLKDGPQKEHLVIDWAMQTAEILSYLHGLAPPLVHRDLSPENLLLQNNGRIALIDFGAAKEIASTFTGTIIGKQSYIAPEQFRGKAVCASDIYSLGATMFFLLTGKQAQALSVSSPSSLNPDLSSELDQLVIECTNQDAQQRPDAASLKSRLNDIAEHKLKKAGASK